MIWPLLRIAAQLRRIAKAIEESNRMAQERDHPVVAMRKPREAVFSRPSVEEWNEAWHDRNPGA